MRKSDLQQPERGKPQREHEGRGLGGDEEQIKFEDVGHGVVFYRQPNWITSGNAENSGEVANPPPNQYVENPIVLADRLERHHKHRPRHHRRYRADLRSQLPGSCRRHRLFHPHQHRT